MEFVLETSEREEKETVTRMVTSNGRDLREVLFVTVLFGNRTVDSGNFDSPRDCLDSPWSSGKFYYSKR